MARKQMNPYLRYVSEIARLAARGKSLPLDAIAPRANRKPASSAPLMLMFSPHPDDECIVGGLLLRLLRENGMRARNVAMTLGSNPERRPERLRELKRACAWLGFELELPSPNGLAPIELGTRSRDATRWAKSVKVIAEILRKRSPRVVFIPHGRDWHPAHVGVHWLVMDALKIMPASFDCSLVETEYWGQMASPNLMVELSVADVADLIRGLSLHAGEVRRNPYHLRLPAWMQDNVRRGAERVGGRGGTAPDFTFAILYRVSRWRNGRLASAYRGGRQIGIQDNPGQLFSAL